MATVQRSFDDLGQPLHEVTFVVVDIETTGAAPSSCEITEVGAVKVRGGMRLGTFQTLVNPGAAIPPTITYLTGITQAMVLPAPRIDSIIPSLLEFVGDAVVVGHNVRFDLSFLNACAERLGYGKIANRSVDTCALARRLVRDEVPNLKLSTLARHFRTAVEPVHRALADAEATVEVLHALLERAAAFGVLGLDDLIALPKIAAHPQVAKLKLTTALPRKPGVYIFRDRSGRVLYVGKAVDLRRRVRSYFSGDERRKVAQLLREVEVIDHIVCTGELEASVLEVRLIHEHLPRFNRQAKLWRKYAYVKLTLDERFPRLSVVRQPRGGDGCLYLGPVASAATAKLIIEAVESALPIRRCARRPTRVPMCGPCTPAQLGVATCPCAGGIDEEGYRAIVDRVVLGMTLDPDLLLGPLGARMERLAGQHRFEEAAAVRDRAGALARALRQQRRLDALRAAGRLVLHADGEGGAVVDAGLLVAAWAGAEPPLVPLPEGGPGTSACPVPKELADELAVVARWLDTRSVKGGLRLLECEGVLAEPARALPSFEPLTR